MTNRTNKVIKRLLYDEQKQWHNENNWSIFQDHLLSKGVTSYRHPTTATAGLDKKITFLDNIKEPWQKIGQDIDGEAVGDQSGYSVSLSADGTIVAIGAINNDGNDGTNSIRGHVRVYEFKEGTWQQLGGDIDGEAVGDQSGWSVSLSADGSVVAIGAINNDGIFGNESYSGHVRIYRSNPGKLTEVTDETFPNFGPIGWDRIGEDINGEAAVDQSGYSVSLNADGTIVAISSTGNDGLDGTDSWRGHVRVYEFKEGSWNQKGVDIDGEAVGDESGYSVTLSADGSVVAIGAIKNDGLDETDSTRGHVRVYEFKEGSWNQKGVDIDGEAAEDWSGYSVSLSADGSVVAIGAPYNDGLDGTDSWRGHVRVYEYDGSSWNQKGVDIDGEAVGDESGYSVSLSADGSVVAIGAINNDSLDGTNSIRGHVRVYKYLPRKTDDNGFEGWHKIGLDIDGEAVGDQSGYSLSLSADGTSVAITAIKNDGIDGTDSNRGHVRVYRHNVLAGISQINHFNANPADTASSIMVSRYGPQWEQVGADINGEAADDESGTSVSMSVDGSVVAIGSPFSGQDGSLSGHVRIYQYGENENGNYGWHKLGETIQGEAVEDFSGCSVSLSADGFTVAIGADMVTSNRTGHVRVYEYRKYTQDEHDASKFHHGSTLVNNDQNKPLIITENFDTPPVANNSYWIQKGIDIDGVNIDDQYGYSVSLSADGSVVAIGAIQSYINEVNGYVRIFKYSITDGNTDYSWNKLGSDIVGEDLDGRFGESLSLSADGTVVAIGDRLNDNSGVNSGRVRVYKYQLKDTLLDWHPQGDNIEGEAAGDGSGRELSLSADGSVVAIGARFNNPDPDQTEKKAGHVRVYKYNPAKTVANLDDQTEADYGPVGWDRLGADIDGDLSDHIDAPGNSGYASGISLSNDGFIVAIGNPFTDTNGTNSGHVRIYQYEPNKTQEDGNGPRGWNRVGEDIYGEVENDFSGNSVSLSGDGSVVAIGATKHDADNKINSGHVRVFQIAKRNNWVQQGLDIDGEAADDESGYSVSLSGDGSFIAIGAYNADNTKGHVRVYRNESGMWKQVGADIEGDEGDYSGGSICLTKNGYVLATSSIDYDSFRGRVRVFQNSNNSWNQLGADIVGETEDDVSGWALSCVDGRNEDKPLLVAIGATRNDGNGGEDSGHVRVYEYKQYTNANDSGKIVMTGSDTEPTEGNSYWIQVGQDIDGEAAIDQSGTSVSFSADGETLAVGAIENDNNNVQNSGHVRVYRFSNIVNNWAQIGQDIDGETQWGQSGYSVSLNENGSILAIGAPYNNGYRGQVRVYRFDQETNQWNQIGDDIDGEDTNDNSGKSVSLNADGTILAIGDNYNVGINSGRVRVYKNIRDKWQQLGGDIVGEAENDKSGISVSLSADGLIVAIGAYLNDGANGIDSGHTRVYKFTGWGLGA